MLKPPFTTTSRTLAVCTCTALCFADPTGAAVEYDALNIFNAAQPAFDLGEGRPDLALRRPTVGAINSAGQVVGTGDAGGNQLPIDTRPFFYDPDQATAANLGDLTGDYADPLNPARNAQSQAMSINDAGWVVGASSTSTDVGNTDDRPFFWADEDDNHARSAGEMQQLALNPGAAFGKALRVNNNSQVLIDGDTGLYRTDLALNAGTLSEPNARSFITPAATLPDMNDAGEVSFIDGNAGFVWRDLNDNNAADLGETAQLPYMSTTSQNTTVFSINNAGQVVGTMRNDHGRDIGFIWTDQNGDNLVDWADTNNNGVFEAGETSSEVLRFHGDPAGIDATIGSTFVFDINDHGVAVGGYFDSANRMAFIYDPLTGMRFLDALIEITFPLELREADAINNDGVITAVGRTSESGEDRVVLLTPLTASIDGDLDGDGFVGIDDLNTVLSNWNQSVPPGDVSQGDPSDDGFVGIDDLNTVLGNWNAGTPPNTSSNIPEPGTLSLFALTGLCFHRRR